MIELLLTILNELNMTTTNFLYFSFGVITVMIYHFTTAKDELIKIFHQKASALYESYNFFGIERTSLMGLYNKVIIRSIAMMALNGSLTFKTYDFVDREVALISGLSKENATLLVNSTKTFLDEVIDLQVSYHNSGILSRISNIFSKRKK